MSTFGRILRVGQSPASSSTNPHIIVWDDGNAASRTQDSAIHSASVGVDTTGGIAPPPTGNNVKMNSRTSMPPPPSNKRGIKSTRDETRKNFYEIEEVAGARRRLSYPDDTGRPPPRKRLLSERRTKYASQQHRDLYQRAELRERARSEQDALDFAATPSRTTRTSNYGNSNSASKIHLYPHHLQVIKPSSILTGTDLELQHEMTSASSLIALTSRQQEPALRRSLAESNGAIIGIFVVLGTLVFIAAGLFMFWGIVREHVARAALLRQKNRLAPGVVPPATGDKAGSGGGTGGGTSPSKSALVKNSDSSNIFSHSKKRVSFNARLIEAYSPSHSDSEQPGGQNSKKGARPKQSVLKRQGTGFMKAAVAIEDEKVYPAIADQSPDQSPSDAGQTLSAGSNAYATTTTDDSSPSPQTTAIVSLGAELENAGEDNVPASKLQKAAGQREGRGSTQYASKVIPSDSSPTDTSPSARAANGDKTKAAKEELEDLLAKKEQIAMSIKPLFPSTESRQRSYSKDDLSTLEEVGEEVVGAGGAGAGGGHSSSVDPHATSTSAESKRSRPAPYVPRGTLMPSAEEQAKQRAQILLQAKKEQEELLKKAQKSGLARPTTEIDRNTNEADMLQAAMEASTSVRTREEDEIYEALKRSQIDDGEDDLAKALRVSQTETLRSSRGDEELEMALRLSQETGGSSSAARNPGDEEEELQRALMLSQMEEERRQVEIYGMIRGKESYFSPHSGSAGSASADPYASRNGSPGGGSSSSAARFDGPLYDGPAGSSSFPSTMLAGSAASSSAPAVGGGGGGASSSSNKKISKYSKEGKSVATGSSSPQFFDDD
ncbi:unnamed protein product [Amoebophrya sp. A25]|nr:unnamed protein product [Amoebophrya sp. A25]|eukprot:GSA25T00023494001.1